MAEPASKAAGLPPGPGGLGVGNLIVRLRNPLGFYERLHEEYGDIACFRLLSRRICVVYSPDIIEEVLISKQASFEKGPMFKKSRVLANPTSITADGAQHRRIRKLIQPAFMRKAMSGYAAVMVEEALRARGAWRDGDTIDIDGHMHRMALNIITRTFFGPGLAVDTKLVKDIVTAMGWSMVLTLLPLGDLVARLPLARNRQRDHAVEAMDRVIHAVIRDAHAHEQERTELIWWLVHAEDEDGVHRALSDGEVRDESLAMILAGHETSANALTWCFYYLSRNPRVRERLEAEVDQVLGGEPPAMDDCDRLPYTRAVFDEVLRVAPPTYIVGRTAIEDTVLGGYRIPRGTVVQPCWRIPQREEKYFPEAAAFRPDRWLANRQAQHPPHAYVPFGSGLRTCIGAAFARMESVIALAAITQRWRVEVISEQHPEVITMGIYRCRNGLPCTVHERRRPAPQDAAMERELILRRKPRPAHPTSTRFHTG